MRIKPIVAQAALLLFPVYGFSQFGKTYDTVYNEPFEPIFRVTRDIQPNGEPRLDAFMLIKGKANGYYDINGGLNPYNTFQVGNLDVWSDPSEDLPELQMDLQQSQIRLRSEYLTKDNNRFVGYIEGDFWGAGGTLRIRHAWFNYKFLHFGRDWSTFADKDVWPNVFDWDGPPSGIWIRTESLKLNFSGGDYSHTFSFEINDPSRGFQSNLDQTITVRPQTLPDIVYALRKSYNRGHWRVAAMYRNLNYETDNGTVQQPGWGVSLSGSIETSTKKPNSFQWQASFGQSIGNYLVGFGGKNYNAYVSSNNEVVAIPAVGAWMAYEHYFDAKWHVNLVAGFTDFSSGTVNDFTIDGPDYPAEETSVDITHGYFLGNVMYNLLPNVTLGIEYNHGSKAEIYQGTITTPEGVVQEIDQSKGANRISFGAFFAF